MKKALAALALAALFGSGPGASAQTYPSKPITMIVPFAAGGATDVLARFLGERMQTVSRPAVVVENVTGAGGSIGVGARGARAGRRLHAADRAPRPPTCCSAGSTRCSST